MSEYEQERVKHWSEPGGVRNLTIEYLKPQSGKHGWHCTQCGIYMKAYPISHDLEFTHWSCLNCKKNITKSERDATFDATLQIAKDKCDLKICEYNKEDRTWTILSNEFIGDSRISSKRRPIKKSEREHIIDTIQEAIQEELHISFESFQEYFNEG